MFVLGHKTIPSEIFYRIDNKEQIVKTEPNSVVILNYNIELMKYAFNNELPYAVYVDEIYHAIFANLLNAKYLFVQEKDASMFQNIANEYMFDSKIILTIENDRDINTIALKGIDGVIFNNSIRKIYESNN